MNHVIRVSVATVAATLTISASAHASRPTVVLLHGGGWISGSAADMAPWAYGLRAAGYRVLLPNYPLGDVLRSEQWTQRLMRRVHGWKAAWGVSAGGTIASWLAGRGAVDAAVNAAGPTDLLTWRTPFAGYLLHNTSTRECIAASPMRTLTRAAAPQLLQYGTRDSLIPVSQGLVYARRARRVQPATRLEVTGDGHGQTRVQAMRALAWMRHLNAAS